MNVLTDWVFIYIEKFNITTRIRTQGLWGYGSVGQLLNILYFLSAKSWVLSGCQIIYSY
jgi:hypothetical protein